MYSEGDSRTYSRMHTLYTKVQTLWDYLLPQKSTTTIHCWKRLVGINHELISLSRRLTRSLVGVGALLPCPWLFPAVGQKWAEKVPLQQCHVVTSCVARSDVTHPPPRFYNKTIEI